MSKISNRVLPFSVWAKKDTTVEQTQLWLMLIRALFKEISLSPEEERRESARLELDAAVAFAGGEVGCA